MEAHPDILTRYLQAYLPQWTDPRREHTPEAALLRTGAVLLQQAEQVLDELPPRLEQLFLQAWPTPPAPDAAVSAYAVLTAPEPVFLPAGTAFYLSGDGERLWRTGEDCTAQPMVLSKQVLTSTRQGKVIPLPPPAEKNPTRLFDCRAWGRQRQQARFAHPAAFASQGGCAVTLTFPQASSALLHRLAGPERISWALITPEAELPLQPPRLDGQSLHFTLPPAPAGAALQASLDPGETPADAAGPVLVSTRREHLPCDGLTSDELWLEGGDTELRPFGSDPQLWDFCALRCPDAFALPGAQLTLTFLLALEESLIPLPTLQSEPEYKPIMRRLPPDPPPVWESYTQRVSWEYWNGQAWLPVPQCRTHWNCFGSQAVAQNTISFQWPEDAAPCQVGEAEGWWLRWRVVEVQGSGWLPKRCHAPVLSRLTCSAQLNDAPVELSGRDRPEEPFLPRPEALFPWLGPEQDSWWLCFDRPPVASSCSLYLELENPAPGRALAAWEGTPEGLRPLTLTDNTDGLGHSGSFILEGCTGTLSTRYGATGWWLCFQEESVSDALPRQSWPKLTRLLPGAVRIEAVSTAPCAPEEELQPLDGGAVTGQAMTTSLGASQAAPSPALGQMENAMHHRGRAVTSLDVEQLLQTVFSDVVRTRCLYQGQTMEIGVLLRDVAHHGTAFSLRRPSLEQFLAERSALPTLNVAVHLREPCFYPVRVAVWATPGPGMTRSQLESLLREAVSRFVHPVTGQFHGRGWRLGDLPTEVQLHTCIRNAAPQAVVTHLLLTVQTPAGTEHPPHKVTDPFALPVWGQCTVYDAREEERQ